VIDLILERAVCEVEVGEVVEVSDAGGGEGCDRSGMQKMVVSWRVGWVCMVNVRWGVCQGLN
jgi:hypothetical protein